MYKLLILILITSNLSGNSSLMNILQNNKTKIILEKGLEPTMERQVKRQMKENILKNVFDEFKEEINKQLRYEFCNIKNSKSSLKIINNLMENYIFNLIKKDLLIYKNVGVNPNQLMSEIEHTIKGYYVGYISSLRKNKKTFSPFFCNMQNF